MRGKLLKVLPLAAVLAGAPATFSQDTGVAASAADCQSGTCCPESGSTCMVGTFVRDDNYYKTSGSCQADVIDPYGRWPAAV